MATTCISVRFYACIAVFVFFQACASNFPSETFLKFGQNRGIWAWHICAPKALCYGQSRAKQSSKLWQQGECVMDMVPSITHKASHEAMPSNDPRNSSLSSANHVKVSRDFLLLKWPSGLVICLK